MNGRYDISHYDGRIAALNRQIEDASNAAIRGQLNTVRSNLIKQRRDLAVLRAQNRYERHIST